MSIEIIPKGNNVANYLYMKYVRNLNRSAAPECKVFDYTDLKSELLCSGAIAGLMCSNKTMNYYQFEKIVLEHL